MSITHKLFSCLFASQFRLVTNMTGNLGRKQRFTAFVVTGNKNGLAGISLVKKNKCLILRQINMNFFYFI